MMEDLKNLRISQEADSIVDELKEKYHFNQTTRLLRLAAAYALRNYKDGINFQQLDYEYPKDGTNLNVGTFDENGAFKKVILVLYPYCDTPYKYARVATIFGLKKMKEILDSNSELTIFDLIK